MLSPTPDSLSGGYAPSEPARPKSANRQHASGERSTTYLNITFLLLATALAWRYFRKGGGWAMLKLMNKPIGEGHRHAHHKAHAH